MHTVPHPAEPAGRARHSNHCYSKTLGCLHKQVGSLAGEAEAWGSAPLLSLTRSHLDCPSASPWLTCTSPVTRIAGIKYDMDILGSASPSLTQPSGTLQSKSPARAAGGSPGASQSLCADGGRLLPAGRGQPQSLGGSRPWGGRNHGPEHGDTQLETWTSQRVTG